MSFGPYLREDYEQELGIEFAEERKGWNAVRKRLQDVLEQIAGFMDVDVQAPAFPARGLLVRKLTVEQRVAVNNVLMSIYAEESARQQEELRAIPIRENRERVVDLRAFLAVANVTATFNRTGYHEVCEKSASLPRLWLVRESVAHKFVLVCKAFNRATVVPHVEDCFRPPDVQEGLFIRRLVQVARDFPECDEGEVLHIASSLTAPEPGLAGHQAGAAIDLRLKRMARDRLLPLGNEYAEGSAFSCIRCPYITMRQYVTRMLFASVMRMGGFRLIWTENWHACHGDRGLGFDGTVSHSEVKYGPVRACDSVTGAVEPYEQDAYAEPFLDMEKAGVVVEISRMAASDGEYILPLREVVQHYRTQRKWKRRVATG